MKILSLRLSNLASLVGEQYIDFEAEPLANAGLIAITGKTGAGKSTLLDAMCLALFNQIPRLQGASGHLTDASGHSVSIKDSKHILRRGCIHGFAEVEFLALDQKRYKARWELSRARKKVDGKLKLDHAITCLEDNRVLTQKLSECSTCIQQLIGLSFEQFTRAILLAQSEVGAFLKAKDQDRAELLEYLTNSNIFSLVSQCAFEKTKSFRQELEKIQDYLGHIKLLSQEEIDSLINKQQQLTQSSQQHQQHIQQLEHAQQWYTQQLSLEQQQHQYQHQLEQLNNQHSDINKKQKLLHDLEQFSPIRHYFENIQTIQQKQQQLQQQHTKENEKFKDVNYAYQQQQKLHIKAQQQYQVHEQTLNTLQPILEQGFGLDAKRDQLLHHHKQLKNHIELEEKKQHQYKQSIVQQKQKLNATEQHICTLNTAQEKNNDFFKLAEEPRANIEKINTLLSHWQTLQQAGYSDLAQFEQQLCKLQDQIQQHQIQYGDIDSLRKHGILLQQQQHDAKKESQQLQYTLNQLEQLITEEQQQEETVKQLSQHKKQHIKLKEEMLNNEHLFNEADETLKNIQRTLAEQQLLHADHIKQLRSQLKPQQACMVCGSQQHPFIEHSTLLEQSLEQLQKQQEQPYIQKRAFAFTQWQNSQIQHTKMETQHEHLILQQQKITKNIAQLKQNIHHELHNNTAITIPVENQPTAQLKKYCINIHTELKKHLQQLEQQYTVQQQAQQQSTMLQAQLEQKQHSSFIVQQFKQQQSDIFAFIPPLQQQRCTENPNQYLPYLLEKIKTISSNIKQLQQLKDQANQQQQQLDLQQQQYNAIQQQLITLQTELSQIEQQGGQITLQLQQLLKQHAQSDINFKTTKQWHQHLHQQQSELYLQHQQSEQTFHHLQQQFQTHQNQLDHLQQEINLWQKQKYEHELAQKEWQKQHPHFSTEHITHCLTFTATHVQQLRKEIQQVQQQRTELTTHLKHIQQQLETHYQQQPQQQPSDIQSELVKQKQQLSQVQEEYTIIRSQLIANQNAEQQLQQHRKQIDVLQENINRWGKISELIGSKEGTKFQRIAQEHHLDILVEYANQQLEPLSERYSLQRIPNSLGLSIIDHDMNSEVRPVLSLSGGETFLVSLALALAIANMASGAMKLESLFIDEGFGTLDPTSLHIVMDALDRLQSQGRKVVLISHVQEMHERIPVQIQVKSIGAGASKIQVIG